MGVEAAFVSSRGDLPYPSWTALDEAVRAFGPDYVVIANPTAEHIDAFSALSAKGFAGRVLVEKPAQLGIVSNELPFEAVGIAYNLRFHPVLQAVRARIAGQNILSVRAYAGQDLDTWRPGRPAHEQYSAHAHQGGGVLRDLSHELDYLAWMLGDVTDVVALGGRIGEKTVDSDDAWSILLATSDVPQVTLQLNYFDIPGARTLHVITPNETIDADITAGRLTVNGELSQSWVVQRNDTYRAMHSDMLALGGITATLSQGVHTDSLITDIERSAAERVWVKR
jgi:predicted dehydrogenase